MISANKASLPQLGLEGSGSMDKMSLEEMLAKYGFEQFKWISGNDLVIRQWVRLKCQFTCPDYGTKAMCGPNMPSIEECERFFSEYSLVAVIHKEVQGDDSVVEEYNESLLELEREVFLSGHYKAMALMMGGCHHCRECTGRIETCRFKEKSRPNPEAMGVDVFTTVGNIGLPIEVLTDYQQPQNRYGFLLVK